jgi:hypothetical protein
MNAHLLQQIDRHLIPGQSLKQTFQKGNDDLSADAFQPVYARHIGNTEDIVDAIAQRQGVYRQQFIFAGHVTKHCAGQVRFVAPFENGLDLPQLRYIFQCRIDHAWVMRGVR